MALIAQLPLSLETITGDVQQQRGQYQMGDRYWHDTISVAVIRRS